MSKCTNPCLALLLCVLIMLTACKKKDVAEVDNESQSVEDFSLIAGEFMAIVTNIHNAEWNTAGLGFNTKASPCDSLTRTKGDTLWTSSGHVVPTFTTGPRIGCTRIFADGVGRRGQVEVNISNRIDKLNTVQRIKLRDYNFNGYGLSCDSMVVTTFSLGYPNAYNQLYVNIYNGVCQSGTVSISCNLTLTGICMYSTASNVSGFFRGESVGRNRLNGRFTVSIPESGIGRSTICRYVSQGKLNITPDKLATREVNYGTGNCDDLATFSVNGNTIAFKLK